jgi:GNAT superfamily N-acetyltransferase
VDPRFEPSPADVPPGSELLAAMVEELSVLYERAIDDADMPSAGPADFAPPGGNFLVGRLDGVPVACGGIKPLADGACEIKRMYVAPEARGRGIASHLLAALEDAASALGYRVARLDTGPKQPHAQRLYERAGYRSIENFNANPVASFFGEKQLG